MAKRALVTGACGFTGTHMVELLKYKGWEVVGTDLAREKHREYYCESGDLVPVYIEDFLDRMEVELRATLEEVHLFQKGKMLAIHPVLEGRGQRRLHPEHRRHSRPDLKDRDVISWGIGEIVEVQRRPLEIYEGVLR